MLSQVLDRLGFERRCAGDVCRRVERRVKPVLVLALCHHAYHLVLQRNGRFELVHRFHGPVVLDLNTCVLRPRLLHLRLGILQGSLRARVFLGNRCQRLW